MGRSTTEPYLQIYSMYHIQHENHEFFKNEITFDYRERKLVIINPPSIMQAVDYYCVTGCKLYLQYLLIATFFS